MATDRIVNEDKQVREIAQQLKSNAAAAVTALSARAKALNVVVPPGLADSLNFLADLAVAASADAVAKDAAHGVQKTGSHGSHTSRDEAATVLYKQLRDGKVALSQYYGAANLATAFPPKRIPRQPDKLLAFAKQVFDAVQARYQSWSVPAGTRPRVSLDMAGLFTDLAASVDTLDKALKGVNQDKGTTTGTQAVRDDAELEMHDSRRGVLHIGIGTFELAGMHEIADHLTTHHHLGRPHSATSPAESQKPPAETK